MSETKNINSQETGERDEELFDVYELGYHILPTIAQDELEGKVEEIYNLLKDYGAELIMDEAPKLIELAYTMIVQRGGHNDKYDKAYFGWIKFELEKSKVPELQKELKENQNVLRFILFKTVKEDTRANIDLDAILGKNKKEGKNETEINQNEVKEEQDPNSNKDEIDQSIENMVS